MGMGGRGDVTMRTSLGYRDVMGAPWGRRGDVMGCVGWGRCRALGGTHWGHRAVTPQVTVVSDGDEVGAARARGDVEKADVVDGER